MSRRSLQGFTIAVALLSCGILSAQDQPGSIRGVVYDADFDVPLGGVQVRIAETSQTAATAEPGNYVFSQVLPGRYTLVFSKEDYIQQVRADVAVTAGQLTDVDVRLVGEFTEMDEMVVQDILEFGVGTEAALLLLRFESPALMDSISSELMSRAGAGDAAAALRLVAGASVAEGKSAVIRGLPDRYVSSQMNGVRLPTADEDKRAVQLDQFPAPAIESIQVSKTFTPDQQGDASGGAVDVRLKSIPDQAVLQIKGQTSYNTQVTGRGDFLSYDGGGVNFFGEDDGGRDIQTGKIGSPWDGAVGTTQTGAPVDYKWSASAGGKHELDNGLTIGGFASVFYERDSSFFDNGIDDSWWLTDRRSGYTPHTSQGTPQQGNFNTALFDVTQGKQSVQWGGLASAGVESENHSIGFTYLYTRIAEDTATLAEDTRGKEYYYPGYDPKDPMDPGNLPSGQLRAPYLRLETLNYTERTTETMQLNGRHRLPIGDFGSESFLSFHAPELEWILSHSTADLNQPDKRVFGSIWVGPSYHMGIPPFQDPYTSEHTYLPYKPSENINLGNLQRIWKQIGEDSNQYTVNLKFPLTQWSGQDGYFKFGVFGDDLDREFNQDTFSNFGDSSTFSGGWHEPWSEVFPGEEGHDIRCSTSDVDYTGNQKISAWYSMVDMPFTSWLRMIGGARHEQTQINVVNDPERNALWYPPGDSAPRRLEPGEADVHFQQDDVLPSIGMVLQPFPALTLRTSYSETIARQTFKELTPILQQEYAGGPVFIGNPSLQMSSLQNYDVRADYVPYESGLISASWFRKSIDLPIEYVQRPGDFTFTTAVNYPTGTLAGYEMEMRQRLEHLWEPLQGMAVGANATFISSRVDLPQDEIDDLHEIHRTITSRDMTNAPDHLYNLYLTYDLAVTSTQFAVFYTVQGDTLIAGAGEANGNFVPSVYAKQYDTLNLSISQGLGRYFRLQFQAKNLTNPEIQTVYRTPSVPGDVVHSSYTKGIEYSIGISAEVSF